MSKMRSSFATPSGRFSEDGLSFIVNRPDAPHPLVNVISTGEYGVSVSQTGAGRSWARRPSEPVSGGAVGGGRALYLRDEKSGKAWSVGWQPLRVPPESYECVHGVGHTLIVSRTEGVQAQWLTFVPTEEPVELWRVRLKNLSRKPRTLSLWSGVEWDVRRAVSPLGAEKPFVHEENRILLAKSRPTTGGGDEGVFFHGVNLPTKGHALDRRAFWGPYGSSEAPEALSKGRYLPGRPGREPFAGFCVPFTLKPGEERSVLFTIGWAGSQAEALQKARRFQDFSQVDGAWNRTQIFWDNFLSAFTVRTPDPGFDLLVNTWLKYQALSQGLWGGRGPRDGRILLTLDPARLRREILARASSSPRGAVSDVPWPVLLVDYLRETGDGRILLEKPSSRGTLYDAASRAVRELLALPPSESGGTADFLSDWADMVLWAESEGHLPAKEKAAARRMKAESARRGAAGAESRGAASLRALEGACRRGRAKEAWDIFLSVTPLPSKAAEPPLFAQELSDGDAPPAALHRLLTEKVLGIRPAWNGLRVRPCLPPHWREARAVREFRGALYTIRFKRDGSKPAGFQEMRLNGAKLPGDVLPLMLGRRNEVLVVVGRGK